MIIRAATAMDFPDLIRLNQESEHFLSPLTPTRLELLFNEAAYCCVVDVSREVVAFLLAFREGCSYDSVNYRWFIDCFERFMYIDRVVVSNQVQGQGVGRMLYDDFFAFARQTNAQRLTCEFDIDPPNEASRRFHERYGFVEIGRQSVAGGTKLVSLQTVSLLA